MSPAHELDEHAPVFVISVAAELSGMHPQTLRQYDRLGLVVPQRQGGEHRRYSSRDVERLRRVAQLSSEGISLEGVRRMIDLERQAQQLQQRVAELEGQLDHWRIRFESVTAPRVFAAGSSGEVSIKASGREARARQAVQFAPLSLTTLRRPS